MHKLDVRLAGPGAFRFLLSLLVFVDHTTRFNIGIAAVFVFFILSGYWICTMWTSRYAHAQSPYQTFVISRLWRIVPVFALASAITWVVLAVTRSMPVPSDLLWHQIGSGAFIFGYDLLQFRPNGPAWSLDVEVQFYLIAPLLIALLARRPWILMLCATTSLGFLSLGIDRTLVPYLAFFALGVVVAQRDWRPRPRVAVGSLIGTLAIGSAILASPWRDLILGGSHPTAMHGFNGIACVALALALAPWAIHTTKQGDTALDGMLGDLSFILYLLHWPILGLIATGDGSVPHRVAATGLCLLVTLLASLLVWRLYDRPINAWRSAWVRERLAAGRTASGPRSNNADAALNPVMATMDRGSSTAVHS